MPIVKNQEIELTIESLTATGSGVGHKDLCRRENCPHFRAFARPCRAGLPGVSALRRVRVAEYAL